MVEKTWEERTDATLDRIETQIDDGEKQTGFALDFRERVVTSLTRIEGSMEQNIKDHEQIKGDLKDLKLVTEKIPLIEKGLNNHLQTHDTIRKSIYYPVLLAAIIAVVTLFCKLVLKLF